ncbi:hypothetical protein JTB14_022531 [Gonioctena quinquepunctata]|nr:hypothetical protein JTB14_022531 [Gonioctena quinquepunctata]
MSFDDYKWHYDYVRLAWDAGFSFGKGNYTIVDKNQIYIVNIDRIIKERDVASVERYIPTVLQYVLDKDQAEILDTNFVNLFRMSQLSVEYLLFCKKYLDNTVIIMKKDITKLKQEVKQLKLYTEELEMHLSVLTKNTLTATFRCEKCPKVFSSEEYLNSHLKRRHNEEDKVNPNNDAEKLHLEIKELKERLNNTEKLIQKENDEVESDKLRDDELGASKLINEIQKNFERFREQVENKIESLQSDKNFYDDKYDKLFNVVLECRNKESIIHVENVPEKSPVKHVQIRENTTQTETPENSTVQIETEKPENSRVQIETENDNEIKEEQEILEKRINVFGENIENRISTGLYNIEHQMKTLGEKLAILESNQKNAGSQLDYLKEFTQLPAPLIKNTYLDNKPKIKPRNKFTKPTVLQKPDDSEKEVEKITSQLNEILYKPKMDLLPKLVQPAITNIHESSESETDSETTEKEETKAISNFKEEDSFDEISINKHKKSHISNKKETIKNIIPAEKQVSIKKTKTADRKLPKEKIQKEITDKLHLRLQEMGISPNWKGIPMKTFVRALEIVEHQASLNKKLLPNYASVKKSIEKSLNKDFKRNVKDPVRAKDSPNIKKDKPNLIQIRYKRKSERKMPSNQSVVTIKNRSLYETDSESDATKNPTSANEKIAKVQADVIEELKMIQSKSMSLKKTDTDSDLSSMILSDDKNVVETKSSLKSYPSDGSLVKKKVLFDIEGIDVEEHLLLEKSGSMTDMSKQDRNDKSNVESSFSDFEIE